MVMRLCLIEATRSTEYLIGTPAEWYQLGQSSGERRVNPATVRPLEGVKLRYLLKRMHIRYELTRAMPSEALEDLNNEDISALSIMGLVEPQFQ